MPLEGADGVAKIEILKCRNEGQVVNSALRLIPMGNQTVKGAHSSDGDKGPEGSVDSSENRDGPAYVELDQEVGVPG